MPLQTLASYRLSSFSISGIYNIQCEVNGKTYVGSSRSILQRLAEHQQLLQRGVHPVPELQQDYDDYGAERFSVAVLEVCKPSFLRKREREIIKQMFAASQGLYNQRIEGAVRHITQEHRIRGRLRQHLLEDPGVSYQKLADSLGVSKSLLWRFVNEDYEPKGNKFRRALGLPPFPEVDLIRQTRNPNGTFG